MCPDTTDTESKGQLTKELLFQEISKILADMTSDWDIDFSGGITPETHIISDLQFESIDVVQFVVQIEGKFQRKDLPFEKLLMVDERYRDDLTVQEVVNFLHKYL
jgi:acyl carrier protein